MMWSNSFQYNVKNNYMIKATHILQKFYWKIAMKKVDPSLRKKKKK